MEHDIESKIKSVVSAVFQIPENKIDNESSPDNIKSWDSLKHMNLVVALEEQFNILFTDEEIIELINLKLIIHIIKSKVLESKK